MAVVGVLALQGSYNEHISGTRASLPVTCAGEMFFC
jgi:glutamine amidotransferase PdxT